MVVVAFGLSRKFGLSNGTTKSYSQVLPWVQKGLSASAAVDSVVVVVVFRGSWHTCLVGVCI